MKPATAPRPKSETRLMVVDAEGGAIADARLAELDRWFRPGDVLVVNDAAALPASLGFERDGKRGELRILLCGADRDATAIVLGEGDHSRRTEERGAPPRLQPGERLTLDGGLVATIASVDDRSPRLVRIRFEGGERAALAALYAGGKPIQYAYIPAPLALWDVQTPYAGRPWASEMPSAGQPLSWAILGRLRSLGVEITRVTHGAGLSSTGDPELDLRLPLPERYLVDARAAAVVNEALREGRRIVAVGTSVVRALESAAHGTRYVEAGSAVTDLVVSGSTRRWVTDAVLTGMHEVGTSHFALLEAFADAELLVRAVDHGTREGYLLHEYGDSMLVLAKRRDEAKAAA